MNDNKSVKSVTFRVVTVILSLCISLLVLEIVAQAYVSYVAKRGKLYEPDDVLGWKVLPNLRVERFEEGVFWHIITDEQGSRSSRAWDKQASRKILITGDSFAFGYGINIEERFDTYISAQKPDWSLVNIAGPGYGPGQQLIAARKYFGDLDENDFFIILTSANDFYDVLKQSHAGRAKPWFELDENGGLVEHRPTLGWQEVLRDKSYLVALVMLSRESGYDDYPIEKIEYGTRIYHTLIKAETKDLIQRGIIVIIAYHGADLIYDENVREVIRNSFEEGCRIEGINCLSLDESLAYPSENFLKEDGHWSGNGHLIVGKVLLEYLSRFECGISN